MGWTEREPPRTASRVLAYVALVGSNMGTQGTGRKRNSNKERSTAEDDALNLIAREVSSSSVRKKKKNATVCLLGLDRVTKVNESFLIQAQTDSPKSSRNDSEQRFQVGSHRVDLSQPDIKNIFLI